MENYILLASVYKEKDSFAKAIKMLDTAVAKCKEYETRKKNEGQAIPIALVNIYGKALNKLGDTYRHLGDTDAAIVHLEEARGKFEMTENRRDLSDTLSYLATCYTDKNKYSTALDYLKMAETISPDATMSGNRDMYFANVYLRLANETNDDTEKVKLLNLATGYCERSLKAAQSQAFRAWPLMLLAYMLI